MLPYVPHGLMVRSKALVRENLPSSLLVFYDYYYILGNPADPSNKETIETCLTYYGRPEIKNSNWAGNLIDFTSKYLEY